MSLLSPFTQWLVSAAADCSLLNKYVHLQWSPALAYSNTRLAFCCQLSRRLLAPRSELVVLYINYSIKLAFGPLNALSPRKLKLKIWFQTQCQSQQVKLHCSENRVASAVFDSLTHSRALRENRGSPSQSLTLCSALLRCGTSHQQTTWCKESFISLTQRQVTCSASSDACLLIPELL